MTKKAGDTWWWRLQSKHTLKRFGHINFHECVCMVWLFFLSKKTQKKTGHLTWPPRPFSYLPYVTESYRLKINHPRDSQVLSNTTERAAVSAVEFLASEPQFKFFFRPPMRTVLFFYMYVHLIIVLENCHRSQGVQKYRESPCIFIFSMGPSIRMPKMCIGSFICYKEIDFTDHKENQMHLTT